MYQKCACGLSKSSKEKAGKSFKNLMLRI